MGLPYWMSEVAAMVGYYRDQREFKQLRDQEEKERCHQMLRKAGIKV